MGAALPQVFRDVFDLLFPNLCWACRQWMAPTERFVCAPCRQAMVEDPFPTCPRCSSSVGPFTENPDGCPACRNEHYAFDAAVRLHPYDGPLRDLVLRMKARDGESTAELLGELWGQQLAPRLSATPVDVIVPIPLHWWRRVTRGFNQTEVLAQALSQALQVPCNLRAIARRRRTKKQSQLPPNLRRDNVKGAFELTCAEGLLGKTILLVDDVMTTGATAHEAARALRKARPRQIILAVLAHGH